MTTPSVVRAAEASASSISERPNDVIGAVVNVLATHRMR
jgi:hypothetical protein